MSYKIMPLAFLVLFYGCSDKEIEGEKKQVVTAAPSITAEGRKACTKSIAWLQKKLSQCEALVENPTAESCSPYLAELKAELDALKNTKSKSPDVSTKVARRSQSDQELDMIGGEATCSQVHKARAQLQAELDACRASHAKASKPQNSHLVAQLTKKLEMCMAKPKHSQVQSISSDRHLLADIRNLHLILKGNGRGRASAGHPDCQPNVGKRCSESSDCHQCDMVLNPISQHSINVATEVRCINEVCVKLGCPTKACPNSEKCQGSETDLPYKCW